MSFSVDANLLLFASDTSSPEHQAASDFLAGKMDEPETFYLGWPTVMAYLRIATHPSIFSNPLEPAEALGNARSLLAQPRVRAIAEKEGFLAEYAEVTGRFPVRGNLVPDAHLATLLRQHGIRTLYTSDTDFRKFDFLEVRDPLR